MAKKTHVRAEDITEKDILSLYETVLPLLVANPEKLDPANVINKAVLRFIWYDFYHYLMDDIKPSDDFSGILPYFEKWGKNTKEFSNVYLKPKQNPDPDRQFDEYLELSYQVAMKNMREKYPDQPQGFHYYRLHSQEYPQLAIGFFRFKYEIEDNAFSAEDKAVFEKLGPHILLLYRTVTSQVFHSQTVQYFEVFYQIFSKIAAEFHLSDTESKFIPEMLFGKTNEEIAERYFIAIATVKKHIKNILKKTDTKNRVDFISKFFTSPERVNLK